MLCPQCGRSNMTDCDTCWACPACTFFVDKKPRQPTLLEWEDKCPACDGTGKQEVSGQSNNCLKCNGKGTITYVRAVTLISMDQIKREAVLERLHYFKGCRTCTARSLKISIRGLRNFLEKYRKDGFNVPEPLPTDHPHLRSHYRKAKTGE